VLQVGDEDRLSASDTVFAMLTSLVEPHPAQSRADADFELLEACRNGEVDAWQRVYDRYSRLIYSVAMRCGLSVDDAGDVTQITFTLLLENLATLRDDSNLGAWLCTVARRHAWRVLKQHHGTEGFDEVSEAFLFNAQTLSGAPAGGDISFWETAHWINAGLNNLDNRCRELLIALYFDEAQPSYTDIAHRLSLPVGSIGPMRARCLQKLKRHLSPD
jgi:RNA polymerase sigma factor (sigma-70 family)